LFTELTQNVHISTPLSQEGCPSLNILKMKGDTNRGKYMHQLNIISQLWQGWFIEFIECAARRFHQSVKERKLCFEITSTLSSSTNQTYPERFQT